MTSIVVHCNWTSATALVTSTPQCHHICFTTCLPPLPRDLSSIVTSAAVSIMLNLRSKTKWHWALACDLRLAILVGKFLVGQPIMAGGGLLAGACFFVRPDGRRVLFRSAVEN